MPFLKKIVKWLLIFIGIITLLLGIFAGYVYLISDTKEPNIINEDSREPGAVSIANDSLKTLGSNWLLKNDFGMYELYVEGAPYERGRIIGKLSEPLIQYQEVAFTNQIKRMIPSQSYLSFLKYVIGFLNRDLSRHVIPEYQAEIYGISKSASDSFNWIGTPFSRILNYHSAHDVGHALQNMMLVGCSSFGVWGENTTTGSMIIGRNFDFWVGDEFAQNKIVQFVAPDSGHRFAYITWGGFAGVVSGMNDKGLTITINAAPSEVPINTATPVSLLAREILQYAKNINEAVAIAKKRKVFVSESFLVGSSADKRVVIIEKSPSKMDVVYPTTDFITSTNHFQSRDLGNLPRNMKAKRETASMYRQKRLEQLLHRSRPLDIVKSAAILRNPYGLNDKDIGWGNEKAINQLIAHHSIIMMPDSLRFWVSTEPWALGEYVCYDLNKVFSMKEIPQSSVASAQMNIPEDPFVQSPCYRDFLYFRTIKNNFTFDHSNSFVFNPDSFMFSNPSYYDTYRILGDYYAKRQNNSNAEEMYHLALTKEIATENERRAIQKKLKKLKR